MVLYYSCRFLFLLSFSGGYDSSYLLLKYAYDGILYRVLVVHYDHAVRDESSIEFFNMAQFLFECNVALEYARANASMVDASYRKLRILRYSFVFEIADKYNIMEIVTGHNNNDMVENFFIRIANSSGIHGLTSFGNRTLWLYNGSEFVVTKALINTRRGIIESRVLPMVNDRLNVTSKKLRVYFRKYLSYGKGGLAISKNVEHFTKMLKSVLSRTYAYYYNSKYTVLCGKCYINVGDIVSMVKYVTNACFCINSIFSHKIRQNVIRELVIEYISNNFSYRSVNMGTVILFDGDLYVFRQYRFVNAKYCGNCVVLTINCAHTVTVYYDDHTCMKPRLFCFNARFDKSIPACVNRLLMRHQAGIVIFNLFNDRMFIVIGDLDRYISMFVFGNDIFIIENRYIKTYHI